MAKRMPYEDPVGKPGERLMRADESKVTSPDAGDMEGLLHKLSVLQAELESKNENLRRAEEARQHYSLLFDDAPVAYVVL